MHNIADRLSPTELWVAYDYVKQLHGKTPLLEFDKFRVDGYEVVLYAKMDTLNPGGSFKDRGAKYFVHKAIESGQLEAGDTIVTASAGNHAKGVAGAAQQHGLRAIIYMPSGAPIRKIEGTRSLGGIVELVDGGYQEAAEAAFKRHEKDGVLYVHAYEHEDIITGQSTVVTEAMMQLYSMGIRPDFFVFPFGGGGLANGGSFATRHFDEVGYFTFPGSGSKIYNYAVQAEGFNTMFRSMQSGKLESYVKSGTTIADGIAVPNASEQMFNLTTKNLDGMFCVTEEEIRSSIRRVYHSPLLRQIQELSPEDLKIQYGFDANHIGKVTMVNVVEGAAATAFACAKDKLPFDQIASNGYHKGRNQITGVVIASGNNIDNKLLQEILSEC